MISKGGGSAGGNGGQNRLSSKPSQLKHMFADRPGHLPDTPENRTLLESVANNPNNYLGTDSMNTQWYAQIQPDGSQIWARVWNGSIFNGGINEIPREWNPVTGLNNNPFGQGVIQWRKIILSGVISLFTGPWNIYFGKQRVPSHRILSAYAIF